jgi:hypothetical protein
MTDLSPDSVVFRPDLRRLLRVAVPTAFAVFGASELFVRSWSRDLRLIYAVMITAGLFFVQWMASFGHRWLIRIDRTGLDAVLDTGQLVHIPWRAVASVALISRVGNTLLQVQVAGIGEVQPLTAPRDRVVARRPWQSARITGPDEDGCGTLGIQLVSTRPGGLRLGAELARHLPASALRL